jgi:hypothetical protein
MTYDMEERKKERSVTEFLHVGKKIAPVDILWRLLNVYGDQTVDVNRMKRWVMLFISGDSHVIGHVLYGPAQLSANRMRIASISSSAQIGTNHNL